MKLLCLQYTKLNNSKTISSNFDFDFQQKCFKQFIVKKISFYLKNRILYYPQDTLKVVQKNLKNFEILIFSIFKNIKNQISNNMLALKKKTKE